MFEVLRNFFRRAPIVAASTPVTPTSTPISILNSSPDTPPLANSVAPVFIDTETTGLNQDGTDEVLEVAIVDAQGSVLLNTLVRPVRKTSWPKAQAIHGIRPEDVTNAPSWDELLPKIGAICAEKMVIIYNAPFDTSFFPPGFFPSVACAMRRYAELDSQSSGWVKLSDAAATSGYIPTRKLHRALEDASACRHIWLFRILALEKEYPPIIDPQIIAELPLDGGTRIPLNFKLLSGKELRLVTHDSSCAFWTKDHLDEINVYREETQWGRGKIATLTKADNPVLAKCLEQGYQITMRLIERNNDVLRFTVERTKMRELEAKALPATPVTFSSIDNDIVRCFIAHQSGMCDAIGTWEGFRKVESEIAHICKDRGGRYYKTKAKGAKFAIIFNPFCHSAYDVWNLQQAGFKVTTFDRAVEHFGLVHLWDCARYLAHVDSLEKYIDTPVTDHK